MSKVSTFIIPDIHGNLFLLEKLLNKLPLVTGDRIITLGDYVDRGPSSREVIDVLLMLKSYYQMVYLMGNHEQIFIEFLNQRKLLKRVSREYQRARKKDGLENAGRVFNMPRTGGVQTLLSYGYPPDVDPRDVRLPDKHLEFFGSMRLSYLIGNYLCVHGGVSLTPQARAVRDMSKLLRLTSVRELLWSRDLVEQPHIDAEWGFQVVCGHTPQLTGLPLVTERVICLDVGAGYDTDLCALELDTQMVYYARRRRVMYLSQLLS